MSILSFILCWDRVLLWPLYVNHVQSAPTNVKGVWMNGVCLKTVLGYAEDVCRDSLVSLER